jgi:hypothetical protein
MTESRLARIAELFDAAALEGRTAAEIADDILPFVPIGDAADWMRPGVMAWVRNTMKGRGLVQSPAAGGAYAQVVQLEFDRVRAEPQPPDREARR